MPPEESSPAERVAERVRAVVQRGDVPGLAYAAVTEKETLLSVNAGRLAAGADAPVQASTQFMVASVTKALTAILAMRLAEQGALDLDAPLSRYLPDHPYAAGVTVGMLLSHTAGVPAPMPLDWFEVEGAPLDRAALLARQLKDNGEQKDPPGSKYRYSNLSYWVAEAAIQSAAGKPFADVFQEQVLAPVGVSGAEASFELPGRDVLASGHATKWSLRTLVFYAMTPKQYWVGAADGWSRFARVRAHGLAYGGLYATTTALAKVLQDLLREDSRLLTAKWKERMFQPVKLTSGEVIPITEGWITGELDGARYVGKQGGGLGYHGNVRVYPELGIATVYLANTTEVTPGPIDARSDELDAEWVRVGRR